MAKILQIKKLCNIQSHRLPGVIVIIAVLVVLPLLLIFPYEGYVSFLSHANAGMVYLTVNSTSLSGKSQSASGYILHAVINDTSETYMTEEAFYEREEEGNNRGYKLSSKDGEDVNAYQEKEEGGHSQFTSEGGLRTDRVTKKTFNQRENLTQEVDLETGSQLSEQVVKLVANASEGITINVDVNSINEKVKLVAGFPSPGPLASDGKSFSEALDDPKVDVEMTMSSVDNGKKGHISQPTNKGNESLQASSFSARVSSRIASKSVPRGTERRPISISEMNALFCQGSQFANAVVYDLKFNSLCTMRTSSLF